ncbi:hypothetical protein CPHO_04500 [Corynebacterium phocae]|uniref:Inositol-phosphate phosphatase n=1 Tax=Corynebacterium phocae TaxID=161895 RepID=A0A1L7D2R1_9CORY|nr:inositol monophosphatase family protein [Corynebacterium phocae]APT92272.1 hypothetical protein CPHO_04500 [Corynebacterium phocae]KAA8725418.1 inositol-phosphate phosphatase [Corynebacterium phocae]
MAEELETGGLLAFAEAAIDEVEPLFLAGQGARPAHDKGAGDFATHVDLDIERRLRSLLTQMTGLDVHGEEYGGSDVADPVWVVDPIDGTTNYSAGIPMCGILLALLKGGQPVAAVASFPLLGRRLAAAHGVALRTRGGAKTHPNVHVGISSQMDKDVFARLAATQLRLRMTGSVGLDSALAAQRVFAGAVNFSAHPWDNAAGALLATAAGLVATDTNGNPWRAGSPGLVVGTEQVHATIMDAIKGSK